MEKLYLFSSFSLELKNVVALNFKRVFSKSSDAVVNLLRLFFVRPKLVRRHGPALFEEVEVAAPPPPLPYSSPPPRLF